MKQALYPQATTAGFVNRNVKKQQQKFLQVITILPSLNVMFVFQKNFSNISHFFNSATAIRSTHFNNLQNFGPSILNN